MNTTPTQAELAFDERSPDAREQLRGVFDYNALNGVLIWKRRTDGARTMNSRNAQFAGRPAGCKHVQKGGYKKAIVIQMRKAVRPGTKLAHRLIWIWHHGPIPKGMQIDHKDGNPFNNLIENLRLATPLQNSANNCGRKNRIHDLPHGVRLCGGKYQSYVIKEGKYHHCGTFLNSSDAYEARRIKASELYGEFNRY